MSVTMAAGSQQETEGRFTRRAPLGRRVVATLEDGQSLLGIGPFGEDPLRRVRDGDRFAALQLVEKAIADATDCLATGSSRTVRILRVQELLAELQSEWHELQRELLAR